MSKIKKKQILLGFEESSFLEFRKIIFQNGMSVQDFFSNIITVINNRDENCDYLFEQVKNHKRENITLGKEELIKEDLLYEMFEEKFNQK